MVSDGDNPTIKEDPPTGGSGVPDLTIEQAKVNAPVERVIELLENQNKILAALSQTITTQLNHMSGDIEVSKILLGKLVKFGPVEIKVDQQHAGGSQGASVPQVPSGPGQAIG